jgi:hypothetical protein
VVDKRLDPSHAPPKAAVEQPRIGLESLDAGDAPLLRPEQPNQSPPPKPSPPPVVAASTQALHAQAEQLADHLRARQKELDHREASLNARAAQLEREERAAQIWLSERTAELEARAQEPPETAVIQGRALARQAEELAKRHRELEASEARLDAERAEANRLHELLIADRRMADGELQAERQRLRAEQLRMAADIEQQRRSVHERAEQVDQARESLNQVRDELGLMHRETLEIRLATEELWSKLSGSISPEDLTRSLARIRTRLADHYRLANGELVEKKEELEQLRQQLDEQYERMLRQKRQFDQWSVECREETEQQAVALAARSRELDQREAEMHEIARRWHTERMEMQHEIRRLRARLSARTSIELPV